MENLLSKIYLIAILAQPISTETKVACSLRADKDYKIREELFLLRTEAAAASKHIEQLQDELQAYKQAQKGAAGDTYIRWGRSTCPGNGTTAVYTGFMAGSVKTHTGTGSNYICLTDMPMWNNVRELAEESFGKITGAGYIFWYHRKNGAADFFGDNMFQHNAPCVVCHTSRRISVMIPGTKQCFDGWRKEYIGYLVSGHHADKSSTKYVCLDRRPEKVPNGLAADEGNRLYLVESVCGRSLPCPPYIAQREVPCVVCSA